MQMETTPDTIALCTWMAVYSDSSMQLRKTTETVAYSESIW